MGHRVMITGASGLLGRAIYKEFCSNQDWAVTGLAYSRAGDDLRKVDLTKKDEIDALFDDVQPSVVIHSAAERRPDVVEKQPDYTKALNESATHWIAEAAKKHGCWVLYISTDYVFDGTSPPYSEDATPNPLNLYGHSKLAGEKITLAVSPDSAVLRVPILYGPVEDVSESAILCMFPKILDTSKPFTVSDFEQRFPTHVADIATACRTLAQHKLQGSGVRGVYHWSSGERMTKYGMCVAMADALGLPRQHVTGIKEPQPGAKRPVDACLSCGRLETLGVKPYHASLQDSVAQCLTPHLPSPK